MNVKVVFRTLVLSVLMLGVNACSDDNSEVPSPSLDVTPANIAGTWKLVEWNGNDIAQGTYCYIVFNRREKTFQMYQKFDSMYPRYITGKYSIDEDKNHGYIISGEYDYGNGLWNHSYIVTELYPSGTMTWTVKGNPSDVSRYERCENIPSEVIEETKHLE